MRDDWVVYLGETNKKPLFKNKACYFWVDDFSRNFPELLSEMDWITVND